MRGELSNARNVPFTGAATVAIQLRHLSENVVQLELMFIKKLLLLC